jgi:hypothetical protein
MLIIIIIIIITLKEMGCALYIYNLVTHRQCRLMEFDRGKPILVSIRLKALRILNLDHSGFAGSDPIGNNWLPYVSVLCCG